MKKTVIVILLVATMIFYGCSGNKKAGYAIDAVFVMYYTDTRKIGTVI